jgi:hypothetical protein
VGRGCSAVRKIYCTGPWKLAVISTYNPLKSPIGVHVHKTTYGHLIVSNTFDAGKSITWVSGRGLGHKSQLIGAKKVSISRAQPPPTCPLARIKSIMYGAVKIIDPKIQLIDVCVRLWLEDGEGGGDLNTRREGRYNSRFLRLVKKFSFRVGDCEKKIKYEEQTS